MKVFKKVLLNNNNKIWIFRIFRIQINKDQNLTNYLMIIKNIYNKFNKNMIKNQINNMVYNLKNKNQLMKNKNQMMNKKNQMMK